MSCSLFLFEKDGASSLGDNNESDSHTTSGWLLFPRKGETGTWEMRRRSFHLFRGSWSASHHHHHHHRPDYKLAASV